MFDRPPLPPFTQETAVQKVRLAEDAWNTRNAERVSLPYTVDSVWRNRSEFLSGREAILGFQRRKWDKELDYRLIKELWARRFRELVSLLRQRELGVRRERSHAPAHREHQRPAYQGIRAQVDLGL